ncbi:MAG: hypothetical protein EXS02_10120 [Planctomycetes bacterium]|nr:hypothetical protein [Planctomycetota bacterium]
MRLCIAKVFTALSLLSQLHAQDENAELTRQFQRFDQDADGLLLRKEFPGSDRQFALLDADKNGKATLAEYLQSEVAKAYLRARRNDAKEPRPRVSLEMIALARFEWLARCDRNHDGKVAPDEWTSTVAAFDQLDFDHDGVLDRRDRAEASAIAPAAQPSLPEVKGELPTRVLLLHRFDKNADGQISMKEAIAGTLLSEAFALTDKNLDHKLSVEELDWLVQALMQKRSDAARYLDRSPLYEVPFDTWDKDHDEQVRQNEWLGPLDMFIRIDLDRDSATSRDEVARYIKRATGEDFITRFDLNNDGKVTLIEFAGPPAAFRRADRNSDGVVSKSDR